MHLRFSQDLRILLERLIEHPLTLSDILTETSERGFCFAIALLVLPFLFPMPPGFTVILGSACLLLSVQMMLGRRFPWLPDRIARFRFPQQITRQLLRNLHRVTKAIEKVVRPRWLGIAEHPQVWQFNGFCISWLTLLLMLPIPFTNPIPTIGILMLVVAMLEADGLLMCISYGLTALITGAVGMIGYLLWNSPDLVRTLFQ